MSVEPYDTICKILEANGFEKDSNGNMVRNSTCCAFSALLLKKYKSVVEFQLEYGYTFPNEPRIQNHTDL